MGHLTDEKNTFAVEAKTYWHMYRKSTSLGKHWQQYRNLKSANSEWKPTLENLAEEMRVNIHAVTQMLNGHSLPRSATFSSFCKAVEVDETQKRHWEQMIQDEKVARISLPQTIGFMYAGVEEAAHFWYRSVTYMLKSVDDIDLLGSSSGYPRYGVTAFCHRERKILMLGHLQYFRSLGNRLAALIIAPAYGLTSADNQHDTAIIQELDGFLGKKIPIVFIDRKMIVGGGPSDLSDRTAIDVGAERGVVLVTIDGYAAGQMAVNELIAHGHKPERIAIAGDVRKISTIYDRWRGTSDALRARLAPDAAIIEYFGTELANMIHGEGPYGLDEVTRHVLDHRPTGIVALTSQIALVIRTEVQRRVKLGKENMLVPRIVALDNVAELGDPADDNAIPRIPYSPNDLIQRAINTLCNHPVDITIVPDHIIGVVQPPIE